MKVYLAYIKTQNENMNDRKSNFFDQKLNFVPKVFEIQTDSIENIIESNDAKCFKDFGKIKLARIGHPNFMKNRKY